jgi:hypothetical protein
MMIEKLYWTALWAHAARRDVYMSRRPSVPEREAFERRMRKLNDQQFVQYRLRH